LLDVRITTSDAIEAATRAASTKRARDMTLHKGCVNFADGPIARFSTCAKCGSVAFFFHELYWQWFV
jgi:hypothetical protein